MQPEAGPPAAGEPDPPHVDALDTEERAEAFAREVLLDPARDQPVVVVSTYRGSDRGWLDAHELARELSGQADVAQLSTGAPSLAFSGCLPPRFDVFDGAFRLYLPGLADAQDPYAHPLFLPRGLDDVEPMRRRLLARLRPAGARPPAGRDEHPRSADAWRRVAECYRVGDVVLGRVQNTTTFGAFVELLPGAAGLVHVSELEHGFVQDPRDVVRPGQRVKVAILSLDEDAQRAELSLKRAFLGEPLPGLGMTDADPPFVDDVDPPLDDGDRAWEPAGAPEPAAPHDDDDDDEPDPRAELERVEADRREALAKLSELRKELRSARDRIAHLERQLGSSDETLASAEGFLRAVRVLHARTYGEADRRAAPLRAMRVGREFLTRLASQLDQVSLDKVLEVCVQVASGRAHEINAREVHRLRSGPAGSPPVTRARDGAAAWRCSLQDHTPSARRLHWWAGSDAGGEWVEFAHVGIHDDMSIPE